jgi:hypothetical protein
MYALDTGNERNNSTLIYTTTLFQALLITPACCNKGVNTVCCRKKTSTARFPHKRIGIVCAHMWRRKGEEGMAVVSNNNNDVSCCCRRRYATANG